jgi:hypothetical protein
LFVGLQAAWQVLVAGSQVVPLGHSQVQVVESKTRPPLQALLVHCPAHSTVPAGQSQHDAAPAGAVPAGYASMQGAAVPFQTGLSAGHATQVTA